MTGRTKLSLVVPALLFAVCALVGPPAVADDSALPSGDFDATLKPASGALFVLRCTGGKCMFLGGGPRPSSQELIEFAQAPVIDLHHTAQAHEPCGHTFVGPVEALHIDGRALSYRYDKERRKAQGRCGGTVWYFNQLAEHDTFAATVVKITGPGGKDLASSRQARGRIADRRHSREHRQRSCW